MPKHTPLERFNAEQEKKKKDSGPSFFSKLLRRSTIIKKIRESGTKKKK